MESEFNNALKFISCIDKCEGDVQQLKTDVRAIIQSLTTAMGESDDFDYILTKYETTLKSLQSSILSQLKVVDKHLKDFEMFKLCK